MRKNAILSVVLACAFVLGMQPWAMVGAQEAALATPPSIDTTPSWNGSTYISSFGMLDTATYGQTITLSGNATLTKFSFFIKTSTSAIFRGFVFEWDGAKATGSALFESAPMSTTQATNFEEVVFNIPLGLPLSGGHQYVLFASTSKDPAQPNTIGEFGAVGNNTAYSGGQFYFLNNVSDTSKWTTAAWSPIAEDLAFKATLLAPASIDTTLQWNRIAYLSSFGMPNTATYGQTITLSAAATLTKFSFFIKDSTSAVFRGFVFEWDGSKATGVALFQGVPMSTSQATNFEEVVFNIPGGIELEAGHQYVLFASTSKDPAQANTAGQFGTLNINTVYGGGQFVYLNNGSDPTQWTISTWSTIAWDLAFRAYLQYHTYLPLTVR